MRRTQTGANDSNRRTFLKLTGAVGLAGLAGCLDDDTGDDPADDGADADDHEADGGDDADEADDGDDDYDEVINYVLNPAESDTDILEEYGPMKEYLESETGYEIELQPTSDYSATLEALRNNQAHIADASPSAAIAGENVVDIVGIRIAYGSDVYYSTITTLPDSEIEELSDLEGHEIAFSDNLSVSGGLYPLYMLSQAGLDIGDAPVGSPVDFDASYSDHATAREELINRGDVMAAGTGEFAVVDHVPAEQFSEEFFENMPHYEESAGTEEPELRLLGESDPIPNAPIVARSNWESPARDAITQALLDAEEEDLIPDEDAENVLWFTGVREGSMDDLRPIIDVQEELGLEFGDVE
ncbi:substrate-binding domain-containing protein [Natronorarus salvus]|uniref:substrate-binding domain-containing protein n=1 Tax=Natronorarus salvus TaxID=3117733 RepID=UPI002F26BF27